MVDLLQDIERLESAVINLTEGASDEKRMAIYSLESMIAEKKAVVEQFEKEFALVLVVHFSLLFLVFAVSDLIAVGVGA